MNVTIRVRLGFLAAAMAFAAPQSGSLKPEDVIDHLEKSISWYRHVQGTATAASDVLARDSIHRASLKALQLAFDFARFEAAALPADNTQPAQNGPQPSGNLAQAAT